MDQNSVVIVTGANAGIGKAAATELAKSGAHVVMVCRNTGRGQEALEQVKAQSQNDNVTLMLCDLGSLKSINAFCAAFREKYARLDVLVNNAGMISTQRLETKDGFEMQFGVNHLGPFLLTNCLLDLLIASAPSRIVNVASGAHKGGRIFFDDVHLSHNYKAWRAYAQSKLANVMFTYTLSERLSGTGVTANCLHPGAVASDIGINRDTGFGKTIRRILNLFFLTAQKGAETAVYLATSPEVAGITGKYFVRKKAVPSSESSYDKQAAERLWELSARLTGLTIQ